MKKFFGRVAAALLSATVLSTTGIVSYAAEDASAQDPLVIDVPGAYLRVTVPDKYDYVFDQDRIYRGDLDPDFDVSVVTKELIEGNIRVDAFSYEGDYTFEAFIIYDPASGMGSVKNLSAYDDNDINEFNTKTALSSASNDPNYMARVTNDGVYRTESGITYGCLNTVFTEGLEGPQLMCSRMMWTVVDGKFYEVFVRSDDPEAKVSDFEEDAKAFADGITFLNAPDQETLDKEKTELYGTSSEEEQAKTPEEWIEEIKNSENADKTMGEIWEEKEQQEEQIRTNRRIFRVLRRVLAPAIVAIIAAAVRSIRGRKDYSESNYNNSHGKRDDDYLDRF